MYNEVFIIPPRQPSPEELERQLKDFERFMKRIIEEYGSYENLVKEMDKQRQDQYPYNQPRYTFPPGGCIQPLGKLIAQEEEQKRKQQDPLRYQPKPPKPIRYD